MSITSFGNPTGKFDELFKKSLVPAYKWKYDSSWTKDSGVVVYNNFVNLSVTDSTDATNNSTGSGSLSLSDYIQSQTFKVESAAGYVYLDRIRVNVSHSSGSPAEDLVVHFTTVDSNGRPEITKSLAKAVLSKDAGITTGLKEFTIYLDKTVKFLTTETYAFYFETTDTGYAHRYNSNTTDYYPNGSRYYFNKSTKAFVGSSGTQDFVFYLLGGTTVPSSAGAYVDIDLTKDVVQLDTFNFTKDTDGTNDVTVDILDTNNNVVIGNITSTTDLTSLTLDKARIKVTLDRNGSSNVPRITSYTLNQYLKGYETKRNLKVTDGLMKTSGPTTFKEVLNIQGPCRLHVASANWDHATYKNAQIEVHVDGEIIFKSHSTTANTPPTLLTRDFLKIEGGTSDKYKVPTRWGYQGQGYSFEVKTPLPYTLNEEWKWKWVIEPIECKKSLIVKIASYDAAYGTNYYIVAEV